METAIYLEIGDWDLKSDHPVVPSMKLPQLLESDRISPDPEFSGVQAALGEGIMSCASDEAPFFGAIAGGEPRMIASRIGINPAANPGRPTCGGMPAPAIR